MDPFTPPSTPTPTPDIPTEPWEATPGVEGFLLGFFFLGLALAFLMWSMNRHLRKIKHNATIERRSREAAQNQPVPDDDADDQQAKADEPENNRSDSPDS